MPHATKKKPMLNDTKPNKKNYADNPLLRYPLNFAVQLFFTIIVCVSAIYYIGHHDLKELVAKGKLPQVIFLVDRSMFADFPSWCQLELFLFFHGPIPDILKLIVLSSIRLTAILIAITLGIVFLTRFFGIHRHAIQADKPWRIKQFLQEGSFFALWLLASLLIIIVFQMIKGQQYGLSYTNIDEYGMAYAVFSFVIFVIAFDAWFYIIHRIMHKGWLYSFIHSTHHLSTKTGVITQLQFSPLEILATLVFTDFLLPLILPLHPDVVKYAMYLIYMKVYLAHSGYEVFPAQFTSNKWLSWLVTNTHHDLHHSAYRYNYAIFFTWWDQWFGTEHPNYRAIHQKATGQTPKLD